MKILTKDDLFYVAEYGRKRGYSRQIGTDLVEKLPAGANFPVLHSMHHDRVQGQRGIPHVRALVGVNLQETWQIDIALDVFDSLPEADYDL